MSTSRHLTWKGKAAVALAVAFGIAVSAAQAFDSDDDEGAVITFSTVGDSRQDPTKPDPTVGLPLNPQDAIWLQNSKPWSRIIDAIRAQKAKLLFFNGDMVMGYGNADVPPDISSAPAVVSSDLMKIYRQYGFWRGMVAPLMEGGTYVIPVAGNHEVQCNPSVSTHCNGKKRALVANENAWRDNMGDLIIDRARFARVVGAPAENFDPNNHPSVGGVAPTDVSGANGIDLIKSDQKQLSYSFDVRDSHFVVINTDTVGNDTHAPVNWLRHDLSDARSRGARHFFVFGHKPAFTYFFQGADPTASSGFDADPVNQKIFWDIMEEFGATYFCGHEHIFNMMQPRAATGGKAWQVMVGSGGSPFETPMPTNNPLDRMYAWATVKVYENGLVRIDAYGFSDQLGPTRHLGSIVLHH